MQRRSVDVVSIAIGPPSQRVLDRLKGVERDGDGGDDLDDIGYKSAAGRISSNLIRRMWMDSLHPLPEALSRRDLPDTVDRTIKLPVCSAYAHDLQLPPDDVEWVGEEERGTAGQSTREELASNTLDVVCGMIVCGKDDRFDCGRQLGVPLGRVS